MALPVSLTTRKQSVEFRRLPLTNTPICNDVTARGRQGCAKFIDHLINWIQEALARRISSLTSPSQLKDVRQPVGSRRPSLPLHVVWIPGERLRDHIYPPTSSYLHKRPPLSISLLSVAYLNRAVFWRLDASPGDTSALAATGQGDDSSPTQVSPQLTSADKLMLQFGCRVNPGSDDSRFLLITPEGFCSVHYRQTFQKLNNLLRWNYPSANDLFVFGLISLNAVLVMAALMQPLLVLLQSMKFHLLWNYLTSMVLGQKGVKKAQVEERPSALKVRVDIITDVVRSTFAGWKSYTPQLPADHAKTTARTETRLQKLYRFTEVGLTLSFGLIFKLFLANLLFLLAALPIVNLMGYAAPLTSTLLHLLRFSTHWLGLTGLSTVSLNPIMLTQVMVSTFLLVYLLDESIYWTLSRIKIKRKPAATNGTPKTDPFITRLYKMNCMSIALTSPSLLARYLVLSDEEFSLDSPRESCSSLGSLSDNDLQSEARPAGSSIRAFEASRLYRKAIELDRALADASKRSRNSLQASEHLLTLLQHTAMPNANFAAKLFLWKYVSTPAESARSLTRRMKPKSASPRFEFDDSHEEDCLYDGGSESEGSYRPAIRAPRRQRKHRQPGGGSHHNWPSWVIPCDECVICWREFEPDTVMAALSCGHAFHAECVRSWLDTGREVCPVCRWPAHLSHHQREKQLICQLIKALRNCVVTNATRNSNSTSTSFSSNASDTPFSR